MTDKRTVILNNDVPSIQIIEYGCNMLITGHDRVSRLINQVEQLKGIFEVAKSINVLELNWLALADFPDEDGEYALEFTDADDCYEFLLAVRGYDFV